MQLENRNYLLLPHRRPMEISPANSGKSTDAI